MKRFWAAIGVLLLLLAACTVSALLVSRFAEKTIAHLERATDFAEENNYTAALDHCKKAEELWKSRSGLHGALLRHSEADQVESGLAKLVSYAKTQDNDEFLALCAEVIHDIEHVRDMELPLLRNVL